MSMKNLFRAAAGAFVLPLLMVAQSYTASIRGLVTDATVSAVPNAKVVATDANRNTQRAARNRIRPQRKSLLNCWRG